MTKKDNMVKIYYSDSNVFGNTINTTLVNKNFSTYLKRRAERGIRSLKAYLTEIQRDVEVKIQHNEEILRLYTE